MNIRKQNRYELEASLQLVWNVFQEFEAVNYSEEGKKGFYDAIHSEEYLNMLDSYGAYMGNKLVGIIAYRDEGKHIALFFVDSNYQGLGFGRKLLTESLKQNYNPVITVHSSLYAQKIYEKLGFRTVDDSKENSGLIYIPMELRRRTLENINDFEFVKKCYLETIEKTENNSKYARWDYGKYPSDDILKKTIENDELFALKSEGAEIGFVGITLYQDEDYHNISWEIMAKDDEVLVIHILAVLPEHQKSGVATNIINEAISIARRNKLKAVRLDCLSSNIPAQKLFEKLNFKFRGFQKLYAENTGETDFYYFEYVLG